MNVIRLFRIHPACVAVLAVTVASTPAAALRADDTEDAIEATELVISASRSRQDPKYTASAVSIVSLSELQESQIVALPTALAREPGVAVVQTGAVGAQSSIFMRGGSGHQTLFFVDGVRMNDRSAAYINFLGAADLGGVGRLEVLRGPQGTLYGSAAMGGVILLDTAAAGDGPARGVVTAGAGSFGTWGAGLEASGSLGAFAYSAASGYASTQNDRPGNDHAAWNHALRVEFSPAATPLLLGATLRRQDGDYEEPGSRLSAFPGDIESANTLGTVFAEWRAYDGFISRLTAAVHERDYHYVSAPSEWGQTITTTENRREILDWQNTWSPLERLEVVGGAGYERSRYMINTERTRDELAAGYLSALYRATDTVTLTAGGRLDDFDTFGSATTWRGGVAWNATDSTKLRATYGTGFAAPGSDDRFGVAQWGQVGNPDLSPEKVRGWDAGIDQSLRGGDVVVSATWFHHQYRNLFEWEYVNFETWEGRIVNRDRASTEGVEAAVSVRWIPAVSSRLAYSYLDARNDSDDVRLIRRPRHVVDAEVTTRPAGAWIAGAGLRIVADRVEGAGPVGDYTTVRLFAAYRATEAITVRVRVENLLGERYEEVLGYPARRAGVFGSIDWRF